MSHQSQPTRVAAIEVNGKLFDASISRPVTIGRDPASDVSLDAEGVSAHHAVLEPKSDGWMFRDVGSEHGSYVDGIAVVEHFVSHDTTIALGGPDGPALLKISFAVQPTPAILHVYPVIPAGSVPALRRKLSRKKLAVVGGTLVVLVVVVTAVAVAVRPKTTPCHFSCGPEVGPRLVLPSPYSNPEFGFRIEYLPTQTPIDSQSSSGVTFLGPQGGRILFDASSGSDVNSAIQTAIGSLNTAVFQDLKPVRAVRGAEIGLVPGRGSAFVANAVPPNGGLAIPVAILVLGSTRGGVTVTALIISRHVTGVAEQPYGLAEGQAFDYPITNLRFRGQP